MCTKTSAKPLFSHANYFMRRRCRQFQEKEKENVFIFSKHQASLKIRKTLTLKYSPHFSMGRGEGVGEKLTRLKNALDPYDLIKKTAIVM